MKKTQSKKQNKRMNLEASVYNLAGKEIGKQILSPEIFGVKVEKSLIAQAVRVYLANQRLGTRDTKTRSEVSGSTRKIYRQKGTGRARHGDIKAPIFIGGGIAHGPKPKDFSLNFPKKMRRKALFSSLTDALASKKLKIITGLETIHSKTKELIAVFENLGLANRKEVTQKILLVLPGKTENVFLAGRNIHKLTIKEARLLSTYDILAHPIVLFMKEAINTLETVFLPRQKKGEEKIAITPTPSIKSEKKATRERKIVQSVKVAPSKITKKKTPQKKREMQKTRKK